MRFAVLIKGLLRGMGHEAPCELLATKTVEGDASQPVYSHCAIIEAPVDLPDGDYEVEFFNEVAVTSRHRGSWVVARVIPKTYAEAANFFASQARRVASAHGKLSEKSTAMSASRKLRDRDPIR